MNMKVFIYAYEDSYYGLHGINTQLVCEVKDIDEAREIGLESAYEVIDMYSDYLLEEDGSYDENESPLYEIYKIKDSINFSEEELNNICCRKYRDDFIEEYCDNDNLA